MKGLFSIPFISTIKNYKLEWLKGDMSAGLTVGVMLIPQGMAYANLAGLPPVYGLYASLLPIFVYAMLGTSRQLAMGPSAMVSLMTASGIGILAEQGTDAYISLAISLALMIGVIQFLLGIFKLGFLVNFLSHPVISGFTSAAAVIIALSQLKNFLGIKIPRTHSILEILENVYAQIGQINWYAFSIGLVGIAIIIGAKKISKMMPGQLFAMVFGILTVYFFSFQNEGVNIVRDIPSLLPSFSLSIPSIETLTVLTPIALAISLISYIESYAVAKSIQQKHNDYEVDSNQELVALGLANLAGSFLSSFPTTGGFSRTAVNNQAGAKTTVASLISVTLVVITILFFTPLFYFLPKSILSAVILVAILGLIDIQEAKHLWKADRTDFWLLIVTFIATLSLGIEKGIGLGVVLSLAMVIYRTSKPHIATLGRVPETNSFRNIQRFENLIQSKDILIIRQDAQLYFANIAYFKEELGKRIKAKGDDLKLVILEFSSISSIDSSGYICLKTMIEDYTEKGIRFHFAGMKGPVRDKLIETSLVDKSGDNCYMTIWDAINAFRGKKLINDIEQEGFTLQTS